MFFTVDYSTRDYLFNMQVVQLSQTNITGVKTDSEGRGGHILFKRALGTHGPFNIEWPPSF